MAVAAGGTRSYQGNGDREAAATRSTATSPRADPGRDAAFDSDGDPVDQVGAVGGPSAHLPHLGSDDPEQILAHRSPTASRGSSSERSLTRALAV